MTVELFPRRAQILKDQLTRAGISWVVIVAIWYWSDWRFLVAHLFGVAIAYRSGKESTKLDMRELLNIFRRGAADRDPP